jgi:hypothetical protein
LKNTRRLLGLGGPLWRCTTARATAQPKKRSGDEVASIMGVLFYPSVTDQSYSVVAEDLDPPKRVVFCDGRRDSKCFGGMAGGHD